MATDDEINIADFCTWSCLPHLLPDSIREKHFPATEVPETLERPDYQRSEDDTVLQHGLQLGQEAMDKAIVQGRLRHDSPVATGKTTTTHPANDVQRQLGAAVPIVWADCPLDEPLDLEYWMARI